MPKMFLREMGSRQRAIGKFICIAEFQQSPHWDFTKPFKSKKGGLSYRNHIYNFRFFCITVYVCGRYLRPYEDIDQHFKRANR